MTAVSLVAANMMASWRFFGSSCLFAVAVAACIAAMVALLALELASAYKHDRHRLLSLLRVG